ncbi:MAG: radical SAM family heme chaperone HemW [Lachnotalea sp.]
MLEKELEIYIHIPFCKKKCNYCDFLSFSQYNPLYIPALLEEIEYAKIETSETQKDIVKTIFFGGGTPSILEGADITNILKRIYNRFEIDKDVEITIEINPGTITRERLEIYKKAGINRISFGLQTTNNKELQELGRIHTYEEFLQNYKIAREIGFLNINVDLLSAIPGQTVESWNEVLSNVVSLSPEHISAYSLIIEQGTKFYDKYNIDKEGLPTEEEERQMYYSTKKILEEAGYNRYEISNYSKSGYECRHNLGYWERVNYIGYGLGASSLINHTRFSNISDMNEYLEGVKNKCISLHREWDYLSIQAEMEEFMFLGLRIMQGVSVAKFEEVFQTKIRKVYGSCLDKLVQENLIETDGNRISLTEKGIDLSNYVLSEFLL